MSHCAAARTIAHDGGDYYEKRFAVGSVGAARHARFGCAVPRRERAFHQVPDHDDNEGRALPRCERPLRQVRHAGQQARIAPSRCAQRMDAEQERWAEALAVERRHGDAAPMFVAQRLRALALAGDHAGVARWQAIAVRLDQLRQGTAP